MTLTITRIRRPYSAPLWIRFIRASIFSALFLASFFGFLHFAHPASSLYDNRFLVIVCMAALAYAVIMVIFIAYFTEQVTRSFLGPKGLRLRYEAKNRTTLLPIRVMVSNWPIGLDPFRIYVYFGCLVMTTFAVEWCSVHTYGFTIFLLLSTLIASVVEILRKNHAFEKLQILSPVPYVKTE